MKSENKELCSPGGGGGGMRPRCSKRRSPSGKSTARVTPWAHIKMIGPANEVDQAQLVRLHARATLISAVAGDDDGLVEAFSPVVGVGVDVEDILAATSATISAEQLRRKR